MNTEAKQRELEELRAKVRQIETELGTSGVDEPHWPPRDFYTAYYVLAGFGLGAIAAMTSLLFNIIGSLIVHQHPLRLIQVYLAIPLGDEARHIDGGLALAVGCCLYLLTGMALGVPFHLILSRWFGQSGWPLKFVAATVLALALWGINFYGLIEWIQPRFFGGESIVEAIPWWVAASTHLVFGWTMFVLQPLGTFTAR